MVDVSGDRGQVLLVAVFGIVVLFVTLALVLNATAHTATMATAADHDGRDAARFTDAALDGAAGVLRYVNRYNDTDYPTLRTELGEGIADWSDTAGLYGARHSARATVALTDTTNGTRLVQANRSRKLTNESGTANWTLATGVTASRAARLNVSVDSLVQPSQDGSVSDLRNASVFRVVVDDGTDTWRLFVYEESDDLVVRVEDRSGTLSSECSVSEGANGYAVVDLSNATLGGTPCGPLSGFDGASGDYSVTYREGDSAAGNYTLTVDQERGPIADGDFGTAGSGEPYATPQVYSATIRVTYATSDVTTTRTGTVPRGDDDA